MKIDANRVPFEGLTQEEEVNPSELDLETELIKFSGPIKIKADISKVTNAVTVNLSISGVLHTNCSRCLESMETDFKKRIQLNYPVNKSGPVIDTSTSLSVSGERSRTIDLNPDIREEIVLDYPIKPLCSPDCKGLCPKCGKNLNEGGCPCAIT